MKMKLLSILGTRPQYVKFQPIIKESDRQHLKHDWIDTGQHYSSELSSEYIKSLGLPAPIKNLSIGSGSHAVQTSKIMVEVEKFLLQNRYDVVICYGDTNSTLGAALAASKLNIPIAHVEAGLRSRNDEMPEETNRKIVDHISTLLFAPTQVGLNNLINEGITAGINSGDVMLDSLMYRSSLVETNNSNEKDYALCTIHRAENTDNRERLKQIFSSLNSLGMPVVIPAHPRLQKQIDVFEIKYNEEFIELTSPMNHNEMINKMINAKCVITDSGGLQKEAYMLKKLCITIRKETEWPETLEYGWNIINPGVSGLREQISREVPLIQGNYFGDGNASRKIIDSIVNYLNSNLQS
jgi:UDP-N-acetylglucosamine 2-epimerase